MRVSTFQIHNQAAEQLQLLGAQTAHTQQQIAQGKRLVMPGDDPVGASRVVNLNHELGARDQFVKNVDAADVHLALEDSLLQQMTEVIQRVQELSLQAGSGIQTAEDRKFIAVEIEERFEQMLALANTKNSNGQYVFSGFKGEVPPFEVAGNTIAYNGDNGQRKLQVDRGQYVTINDSGEKLFMNVAADVINVEAAGNNSKDARLGPLTVVDQQLAADLFPDKLIIEFQPPADAGGVRNFTVTRQSDGRPVEGMVNVPYPSLSDVTVSGIQFKVEGSPQAGDRFVVATTQRQSLFGTVKNIAEGLQNINAIEEPDEFRQLIDSTVSELNSATNVILQTRAEIGARFNTMSAVKDLHQDLSLQLQEVKSGIEDLDFAKAVSDLAYQSFVLEAAQQSFIRINSLSLFDRL